MQDQAARGSGRARGASSTAESAADGVRNVRESIRQAFLVHMMEQQRQFGGAMLVARRPADRERAKNAEKSARQQHAGNREEDAPESTGADRFGGTRTGAESVEPKK